MPGDTRGDERPAVEDPLVELARIVHRNKQSGANVSGRVENTDYFAGLDEVAGGHPAPTDTERGRIEPTFAGTATTPEQTDLGAEEVIFDESSEAIASEPAKIHGLNIPAAAEISTDSQANVSALWPQQPDIKVAGSPVAPVAEELAEPHSPRPADPYQDYRQTSESVEIPGAEERSVLAPSVSLDLEQNLTAELEDELIGALRQSVDETADTRVSAAAYLPRDVDYHAEESAAYAVHSETGYRQPDFNEGVEIGQNVETGQSEQWGVAPVVGADVTAHAVETGSGPHAQRPTIDENDLFAALTATQAETGVRETAPAERDDENPAGIDALFADLDFPDPESRKRAQPALAEQAAETRVSAAEIDDMTWPAAADSVPQVDEDETPPPPEGYDLDAVARAMQESDPSLSGAGVLPPHTSAEKAAMPHAREKSRRGMFVAAGILGIGVMGAVGFFMTDGDAVQIPSGPPPVISGLQEPLKIYPEVAAADSSQSGKLIYDRVDGPGTSGPDRLVLPETPEPAELPPAPAGVNGDADLVPGSPKRVRTLVVRPDGTIISDGDPAVSAQTQAVPAPSVPSSSGATETSRVVATTPVISGTDQPDATSEPIVSLDNAAAAPLPASPATPAIVAVSETVVDTETSAPVAEVPTVLPRKKPDAPVQVASAPQAAVAPAPSAPQDGPLNLSQQASAPAPAAQATPAPASTPSTSGSIPPGTYIVQVTSQRTATAASDAYSSLQRRFPAILANRQAVVVSADLGDRGVFYRARIPTGSRDDANSLCESLQAAGGDCFVRRQP
ncbi:SPOR domain-containing protein [uncultured Roseibium sp.]|uniref:SPOR domain-containing protein n=1 Tax=uncultured Roseibium sp. TaxID=1936171 RepID=UPI00261D30BB|nr:SPOR domain-containing protein [uncultured Roseibium sp.]